MTTRTREELVTQALANNGVLEAGQTPSDEDASTVDGYVDGLLARLSAEQIVSIDDDSEIQSEFFHPVALILADDCALEFGKPQNPNTVMGAERVLRVMNRGRPTGESQTSDYF